MPSVTLSTVPFKTGAKPMSCISAGSFTWMLAIFVSSK